MQYKTPPQRDNLLMFFPLLWIVGLLYLYIAKFELLWAVTADGMNAQGLPVGNLFAVAAALIIATVIILLSHPRNNANPNMA